MFLAQPGNHFMNNAPFLSHRLGDLAVASTRLRDSAGRVAALQGGSSDDYTKQVLTAAGQPANLIQRVAALLRRTEFIPSVDSDGESGTEEQEEYDAWQAFNAFFDAILVGAHRVDIDLSAAHTLALTLRGAAKRRSENEATKAVKAAMAEFLAAESALIGGPVNSDDCGYGSDFMWIARRA